MSASVTKTNFQDILLNHEGYKSPLQCFYYHHPFIPPLNLLDTFSQSLICKPILQVGLP